MPQDYRDAPTHATAEGAVLGHDQVALRAELERLTREPRWLRESRRLDRKLSEKRLKRARHLREGSDVLFGRLQRTEARALAAEQRLRGLQAPASPPPTPAPAQPVALAPQIFAQRAPQGDQ